MRIHMKLSGMFVAAAAAALFFLTASVDAREYTAHKPNNEPVHLDDAKIEAFAKAHLDVNDIHSKYELRLANAADHETEMAIRQEAASEVDEVIRKNGLSLEEYNSIARNMVMDPLLHEKVMKKMARINPSGYAE